MNTTIKNYLHALFFLAFSIGLTACDDEASNSSTTRLDISNREPSELRYEFKSHFDQNISSVSYSGQTARHALIEALKVYMTHLDRLVSTQGVFETGQLVAILDLFFTCPDDICADEAIMVQTASPVKQMSIGEISTGKNLVAKLAGNDELGQHKDWSSEFMGWGEDRITPERLIRSWFEQVEQQAIQISNGEPSQDPNGEEINRPDLSATGLDYTQLTQKFLLAAVPFSQAADDYLDDDLEGKGLNSDHSQAVEGESYTELEHAWDEGFGYFGAARDYFEYSDDELASKGGRADYQGAHDTNEDGQIDLISEFNWGHALNAAKRDRGASTDLSAEAYLAFYQGRALLAQHKGPLNKTQFAELKAFRDTAILAWEKAIAATVIHYINEVLADMSKTDSYQFNEHAQHWSEMKGFALSFQFNPRSPLNDEVFAQLHNLIGQAPRLPNSDSFDEYKEQLLEARTLLAQGYQFEMTDVEQW